MIKAKQIFTTIWRFLTSRFLAIVLMAVAAFAMAIASIIPQQGRALPEDIMQWEKGPAFLVKAVELTGLNNLYSSTWFYDIFGFIIASILYCTTRRMYREVKEHRHQRGLWPSVFFHISFIIIFAGGLVSFQTRQTGAVIITEGDTYTGDIYSLNNRDYLYLKEKPYLFDPTREISITLEGFKVTRDSNGKAVDYAASVYAIDGQNEKETAVRINQPLSLSDGENLTLQNYGLAPLLRVIDNKTGDVVGEQHYKLPSNIGKPEKTPYRLPYTDINIQAVFYPDVVKDGSGYATKSQEPKNPAFYIRVTDGYGKEQIKGLLKMGGTLKGEHISITLKDIKYWVKFGVVRDKGIGIVYTGFALATLSIIWRMLPLLLRGMKGGAMEEPLS
ncbi:MAG: cytochrome c biogenesis protein ResB [Firmicutes bacterium]|nr:cytochrome c biogenesis protein ResB [Bacillota bacterium]